MKGGVDFVYVQNVPNKDLPSYFQMADILVVPSLYDESPNRVVAEGAACGCVIVTSDRGALAEQVKDFGGGCFESTWSKNTAFPRCRHSYPIRLGSLRRRRKTGMQQSSG